MASYTYCRWCKVSANWYPKSDHKSARLQVELLEEPDTTPSELQIKVDQMPGEAKKKPAAGAKKKGAAAGSKKQTAQAGSKKQGSDSSSGSESGENKESKESPKPQAA